MIITVFTRLSAVAHFKFLVFQMRCLIVGGVYLRAALSNICKREQANVNNKKLKYTHFELKISVIKKNNFRGRFRLSRTVIVFLILVSPTIQSDNAPIKRRNVNLSGLITLSSQPSVFAICQLNDFVHNVYERQGHQNSEENAFI